MIDMTTGALYFDDQLCIGPDTSLKTIETIPEIRRAPSVLGRTQLGIGIHQFGGCSFGVGVIFIHSKLAQIILQCLNAEGVDDSAWNIENEKRRKVFHDSWIARTLTNYDRIERTVMTSTVRYIWGSVSSTLDVKGVQAIILIEYA